MAVKYAIIEAMDKYEKIAQELGVSLKQIDTVLSLTAEGSTIPFIARYRKDMTGNLDEVAIKAIIDRDKSLTALAERKETVLAKIEEQGKLTEALKQAIEAAEKLADESDVISAFHQLQDLHQEYRETGPVEKELREQIWQRFKAASTVINKRHQQHFEQIRAAEEENLSKKTALCEKIESIVKQERKNISDWDNHSKAIISLQQEWRSIGFTPQKMNAKIFERFRAACDDFFKKKGDFFKELKEKYADNARRKQELVEKAETLKDSTDWKKHRINSLHYRRNGKQ